MPRNMLVYMVFSMLLASASCPAKAWGTHGHRIIAALAEPQLTQHTKNQISRLLGADQLSVVASWADEMRGSPDKPDFWAYYANAWHFVNLPVTGNYEQSQKSRHGDAVMAIATFSAILQDQPLPAGAVQTGLRHYFGKSDLHNIKVKRFALKFLIHIVADLHQPLHSGYASNHGGNDIKLDWQGKPTNLHALWDSVLLDHNALSEGDYVSRLGNRIRHTPKSALEPMQSTDVKLWLHEDSELLVRIYSHLPQAPLYENDYSTEFSPVVDNQLVKAAVRTAWLLNSLFAGSGPGDP